MRFNIENKLRFTIKWFSSCQPVIYPNFNIAYLPNRFLFDQVYKRQNELIANYVTMNEIVKILIHDLFNCIIKKLQVNV